MGVESALLSELQDIKKSLECLPELHTKVNSLLLLRTEVTTLTKTVQELESSVNYMSQQYDSVLEELKSVKEQAVSRDAEVSALRTAVQMQAEQLERIQSELNDSEQHSRNMNMEIHGLKEQADENLKKVLGHIAGKLEVQNFSLSEVETIHRLPGKT
ncbi:hypothetical protein HPB49_013065 [Dermacentor silvarum]|uniref:Uncharacterized protein n=1 Tax=Dermacentor silvarum TaxID=543639 RepID=A0ACB8D5Q5_DERSI|nr:hypothetical protein HPB49_013065 [Dermacentor silvarum]